MRTTLRWTAAALTGAAIAVLGVLATYWWAHRHDGGARDFGWYAYSPLPNEANLPRRYVDYLPTEVSTTAADWVRLLAPAAVAGAILGLVVLAAAVLIRRRVTRSGAAA